MPGTFSDDVRLLRAFFLTRKEDNTVEGSIYPAQDSTYDLGAIGLRWRWGYYRDLYADTLTVQQIRGLSIRPNLLQNGGFEQADKNHLNQPLGWTSNMEVRAMEPVLSLLDDADWPTISPAPPSLMTMGVQ